MLRGVRILALGLLLGVTACAQPPGVHPSESGTEGGGKTAAPSYTVKQWGIRPRPRPGTILVSPFRSDVEWTLNDLLNAARSPLLIMNTDVRDIARRQSRRMASRQAAGITNADFRTMIDELNNLYTVRDWQVYVGRVARPVSESLVAGRVWNEGEAPWVEKTWHRQSRFRIVGVGVFRGSDAYYATAILVEKY
jgi:hypothetical protein